MRPSTTPVVLTAIVAAALYVFFQIADEVTEAEIAQLDSALLLAFRNPRDVTDPLGPFWLEEMIAEITSLGGYPILVVLVAVVAGYLIVVERFGPALYVVLSVALGTAVSQLLKVLYDRPRPDLVDHLVTAHTASFPSGHATMSTVVYLTLAALIVRLVDRARVRVYVLCVAIALSIAVGLSRIYLGVHWPSDVAAGWALGVAWASLSWLAVSALRALRRGQSG
jgi:undecaprenyl-diphosphatase